MRSIAFELTELFQDLQGVTGSCDSKVTITGLATDSRRVEPGDLFVALPGGHFDGCNFLDDAVQHGAAAVLAERAIPSPPSVPLIVSRDIQETLAAVAARFYGYPANHLSLIGVTGTNGKTTTALILESILRQAGYRVGCIGTLSYRWPGKQQAAPLTTPSPIDFHRLLAEMVADRVTHVVMEVSSHALALKRVAGCTFSLGIFTNLSRDHLDFHGTLDRYFETKADFFRNYLPADGDRITSIINADDPFGQRLMTICTDHTWSYSLENSGAQIAVTEVHLDPAGILASLATPGGLVPIRSHLLGCLNLYNITAAAAAAVALGVSENAIADGIARVEQIDGRLQKVPNDRGFEVVVDFAHTPDAMEKSLECLREVVQNRLWVVFGCGGDRDRGKRPMMGEVAAKYGDTIILTSDNPRSETPREIIRDIEPGLETHGIPALSIEELERGASPGYLVEPDREKAIRTTLALAVPGDMIFIGGKGHETYQIVGTETRPFDDRKVVAKVLEGSKPS